jgi:NhaP-type Na+/H+ or K+/H+ antiporter
MLGIGAMLLARAANVYPISFCINCRRRKGRQVPVGFQHICWFAGLRGAIAFALALKARVDYDTRDVEGTPGAGRCAADHVALTHSLSHTPPLLLLLLRSPVLYSCT